MTSSSYIDALAALDACPPALDWLREQGYPSLAAAWAVCPRGDWMLWLAGRTAGPPGSDSRRPLVLAACACARTALPLYESRRPGDLRPRRAIEVAEAWTRGEATLDEVRVAAGDAYDASCAVSAAGTYFASAAAASASAAAASAFATYAASAAASAASAVAAVAAVAAYASSSAASARARTLAELADIVRAHYPTPPSMEIA